MFRPPHLRNPELNMGTPLPHFLWFNPGNYLSDVRTGSTQTQLTQNNPGFGFTALLQSAGPPDDDSSEDVDITSLCIPTPNKKQKIPNEAADASAGKPLRQKKSYKKEADPQNVSKRERRSLELVINDKVIDISTLPPPVCTCTGNPRQCYRWGAGRWQSSCCTTDISQYPLPMSLSRPGTRMSGRKMSHGAYVKLLQRLAADGQDLSCPIDLKQHWARRGTNKFVSIK